ncbi:amidase [Bacillus suaedae]|uniref:Amidase n=1 Tax=Halalkalibacter suaedae TaxID=2822140 RepID=A0A940WXF8_9BACI|nr:amidase [Bacillus suaedae]MBP3952442.1 amidase [Bacillus suaedae]
MNNGFVDQQVVVKPTGDGKLSGLTFAVKDIFDIKGVTASAGNPDWLRTHEAAVGNAPVIDALLAEGATLSGTTITDELMFSLNGENIHYGTPTNPKDSRRIPGGSSSGSAVVVASGVADFALGTDTGGSVRVPSSYCGLFGIRPTHGAISTKGVIPLAESFDTVGWMARDTETLLNVGNVLFTDQADTELAFSKLIIPTDAWAVTDAASQELLSPFRSAIQERFSTVTSPKLATNGLSEWMTLFRLIQGIEIWETHQQWIKETNPTFAPDIADRFKWASTLDRDKYEPKTIERNKVRSRVNELVGNDGVLVIPTTPGVAPLIGMSGKELEKKRSSTMELCAIAGLTGLPQVTIPVGDVDGAPVGLSFIAGANQDLRLLKWIEANKELWLESRE